MSQVAKSASALERAFLAILVLELEAMVVRLFRPLKLAGVHGVRWTVRLGISIDVRYADLEGRRQQGKEGGVRRRSTLTCCRRTRFSASSVALAFKLEARIPRISLNRSVIRMRAYAVRLLRLRRIEFSVRTGICGCLIRRARHD